MNLAEFHFIRPYWLLSLFPYLILLFMLLKSKLNQGNWPAICDEALLPYLLQDKAVSQSRWPLVSGAIAALLAIIALAGPTWERLPTPVFRNDSAVVIVLDLSKSMEYADLKPNRLAIARFKISDLLRQRKDGQTALVAYSGDAFTVTPLTNDNDTIENQLSALTPEIMPVDGDNLVRALNKAVDLFKQAGLQKGQIVLFTDGGGLEDAIERAKKLENYQLLVIGVGSRNNEPIPLPSGDFVKDANGNIIVGKMDDAGFEALAQAGNGIYQPLTTDDSDIKTMLSSVETKSHEQGENNENLLLDQWLDAGPWLLLLVAPLAALSFRKGLLSLALLVLLPIPKNGHALDMPQTWRDLWQTKDQQAQEAFNNGQYDKAAELFGNPDWKAAAEYKTGAYDKTLESLKDSKTADQIYNKGNALAQSGQLQQALDSYKQALKLKPNDDDTLYNKELVEKELEKQKQQQNQNQDNKDSNGNQNQDKDQNKDSKQSNQSDQDKKQDDQQDKGKQSEDQPTDQTPAQKPEQSQKSTENQPEKKENAEQKRQEEAKNQEAKPEQAEQEKQPEDKNEQDAAAAQPLDAMSKEEQQAHEQWLKRIPDDPGGLLRRKFKYQYEQSGRQ